MSRTQSLSRSPMSSSAALNGHRNIPILPSETSPKSSPRATAQPEAMEITTPPQTAARMGPPANSSPEVDHEMQNSKNNSNSVGTNNQIQNEPPTTNGNTSNNTLSAAAAATSSGPKVVQTAFIHKLYNMLEDQSIRHLISWSSSNESFVMSPSPDFSKVLAQYFKHTNISSFVRQLNMYGFHKVSDVFHTGAPESALWEFKHGQGNFKRGDLNGLREIKRRASRHTLIHRSESFSSPHKPSVSQPGTPAEPVQETGDPRLAHIEQSLYELHARLARTEESNTALSSKCALLSDNLARCQQWNNELTKTVMRMIPNQEDPLARDLSAIQKDIAKQQEMFRSLEDPHESLLSGRQPYFHNMALDQPLSPRQAVQDEHRRPSLHAMPPRPAPTMFRGPPHMAVSPRRYGSIGNSAHQPSFHRPSVAVQPPAPPMQHPLASVSEPGPNLARRHTSADIRDTAGWPPQPSENQSNAPQWPPSPQASMNPSDQHVRDTLASYEFGGSRRQTTSRSASRATSPPAPHANEAPGAPSENGWGLSNPKLAPRFMESAPQTRRSSMASNVHNLLNPAETAEREDDEGNEDRKRKRIT